MKSGGRSYVRVPSTWNDDRAYEIGTAFKNCKGETSGSPIPTHGGGSASLLQRLFGLFIAKAFSFRHIEIAGKPPHALRNFEKILGAKAPKGSCERLGKPKRRWPCLRCRQMHHVRSRRAR